MVLLLYSCKCASSFSGFSMVIFLLGCDDLKGIQYRTEARHDRMRGDGLKGRYRAGWIGLIWGAHTHCAPRHYQNKGRCRPSSCFTLVSAHSLCPSHLCTDLQSPLSICVHPSRLCDQTIGALGRTCDFVLVVG